MAVQTITQVARDIERDECGSATADVLRTHAAQLADLRRAQLADLRRALRAYDLAGPETDTRRQALGDVLTLARQLTEE